MRPHRLITVSLDGYGAGDHDQGYRFGRRPRVGTTQPFSARQYARLLILRSRVQAGLVVGWGGRRRELVMATQDPHTLHRLAAFHFEDLLREATHARLAANSESNVASRRLPLRAERFFGRAQMIRVIALAALGAALLAPAIVRAQNSNTDPLDVAQDGTVTMSNPQSLAAAYGDLSVFILNVAAGNDGVPRQPEAEQAFKEVFAQPVAAAYPSLSPDDQQGLAQLGALDVQLHQAWSSLPVDQRLAARDQWAAAVQNQGRQRSLRAL